MEKNESKKNEYTNKLTARGMGPMHPMCLARNNGSLKQAMTAFQS